MRRDKRGERGHKRVREEKKGERGNKRVREIGRMGREKR